MNRELVLAGVAVTVVVATALVVLLAPGAIADPAEAETEAEVERPGDVKITEATITAGEVTGATATLEVDTYLEHRGGPVENVTIVHRVTDADTGLVEETRELEVDPLEDGSERVVSGDVSVPREGSYEIETFVYEDGVRTGSASHAVGGVETLTPAYADTGVEFHRFDEGYGYGPELVDLPAIEYTVDSTADGHATLEVSTYLTNTGDDPEDDLRLELRARQSGSNVVADETAVDVDPIEPGETATPSAEVTVPEEYDYYLDAVLWKGETIVETDRAPANLGPGELTVNATTNEGGLEVSDFASDDRAPLDEAPDDEVDEDADEDSAPGFGVAATFVAAVVAVAIARYTHD